MVIEEAVDTSISLTILKAMFQTKAPLENLLYAKEQAGALHWYT